MSSILNAPLHLPAFVNYACQCCGWCCHQYDITFSAEDYERLSKYDWGALEPSLAGKEWAAPLKSWRSPDKFRLRYGPDGACVFLGQDDKCLMHRHVGELGKTLGCCVYPFTFAATPSGVFVGCRFSCRSIAYGIGEPVPRRREFISKQLELCAKAGHVPQYGDTVIFQGRITLPWADYMELEEALIRVFLRDDLPLVRRLFLAHKFMEILRQARLERVRGAKFREFVRILEAGLLHEAESEPLPPAAEGIFNVLFRQFCFLFQRRQGGSYREMGLLGRLRERLRTFKTGVQFAFNRGSPWLVALPGPVSLAKVASMKPSPLDEAQQIAISRFLAAKIFGKQHFGKLFFNYSLLQGLEFLLLAAGAVMWYARAFALARGEESLTTEDVVEAIRYVDFCYGYSSAPALILERLRVKLLSYGDTALRLAAAQYGS